MSEPERSIFLSGPMGVGKSTIARALAERLGRPLVDLDARIEARAGQPIPAIFEGEGEAGFRRRERDAALALCDEPPSVVALGGGTVTQPVVRRVLLEQGVLVTLEAPPAVLLSRVGGGEGRPLLAGDPAARLAALLAERAAAYAECHARVAAEGEPESVAAEVARVAGEARVPVPLGLESYVVEIGLGFRHRLADRIASHGRPVLVADPNTLGYRDELVDEGAIRVTLDEGEAHKTVDAVARIWDEALAAGMDRRAIVVAVGGGVVGDLAGFAAASLLRGVAFGQVPTTLLAMVDSSVGGKTGFNRRAGKNLVGAFHQPSFVLCDPEVLGTLERAERIAGLAEVVKSAWLEGEDAVAALEGDAEALVEGAADATIRAIRRSVATKARIVAEDARERGVRMHLNLGHTIGHGLEAAAGYGALRHGEAVALGLIAAQRVGRARGTVAPADVERMERLLRRLGLPVDLDARLTPEVFAFVHSDKKKQGDLVRFVVPGPPGRVGVEPMTVGAIRSAVVNG